MYPLNSSENQCRNDLCQICILAFSETDANLATFSLTSQGTLTDFTVKLDPYNALYLHTNITTIKNSIWHHVSKRQLCFSLLAIFQNVETATDIWQVFTNCSHLYKGKYYLKLITV